MNQKITLHISQDEKQMLLIDKLTDELFCRVSFYNDSNLSIKEKKKIGKAIISKTFNIIENKKSSITNQTIDIREEYFLHAYEIEKCNETNKNKTNITQLLVNILGLDEKEAEKRFDLVYDIITHPHFKDKEDSVVKKIYLSKDNL